MHLQFRDMFVPSTVLCVIRNCKSEDDMKYNFTYGRLLTETRRSRVLLRFFVDAKPGSYIARSQARQLLLVED